ncbi:MAG TPA: SDR family oxidoreductase [Solirubrobacteraceae bacterium]|nr:SDR family oxidoreductase [Solirubrobacteraceae bacterium]
MAERDVDWYEGKLAVVTGGGSGMGRELVRQLAARGCSVAACDWNDDAVAESAAKAQAGAPDGVLVSGHACDVSEEAQVLQFRDELQRQHAADHVDLVFSNAGIGGGSSFVTSSREEWERTFAVDWWGVYYCARTFLPLLIPSGDGVLINTSSVNGFWASLGPKMPNSAYATAKFAVKGFTEGLIEDLRTNAPQVRAVVVMPGHVGTDIIANTRRAHGMSEPGQLEARIETGFRERAPLTAAEAATIILDGVQSGTWRILVGRDAEALDAAVRANPEGAYSYAKLATAAVTRSVERGAARLVRRLFEYR